MNLVKFSRLFRRLVNSPRYRRQTDTAGYGRPDGAVYLHEAWFCVLMRRWGLLGIS